MKTGDLFTVNAQNTTLSNLNKLGIFRSVNLGVTPLDSLDGEDTLNVYLSAGFDYPLEAELEMNVTSKSNSFLGPGLAFKVSNNNLFRGGEILSLRLNGNYEWETGNKNSGGAQNVVAQFVRIRPERYAECATVAAAAVYHQRQPLSVQHIFPVGRRFDEPAEVLPVDLFQRVDRL